MVTYALWAAGGPLGLHHLYLGRDSHALLWMLTLGGFGFGWVREFLRIPAYVAEANTGTEKERRRQPPIGPVRFAGQLCVGIYFGTVALIGLNSLRFFYLIVLPLSVGAGVHLVSSVGQQTSDLQKTLTTCLLTSPIFYGSTFSPLPISLAASVTAAQHRRFKPPQTPGVTQELGETITQLCQTLGWITTLLTVNTHYNNTICVSYAGPRLYKLGLAWLAFSAPLGYCIFHNTTATLYYLSDCVAALLDIFWFLPWLRNVLEYIFLMPYRILCVFTGGGYYEEAWRKVLEILMKEYTEAEREALQVNNITILEKK